jgi:regulation of enolase protein 1 (concanavalin A-like superfamily)
MRFLSIRMDVLTVLTLLLVAALTSACFPSSQPPAPEGPTPTEWSGCVVPDLVGQNQVTARRLITDLGLRPVQNSEYSGEFPAGAVMSQEPSAGVELDACQGEVKIMVSLGPPPTETPPPPTETPIPPPPTPLPGMIQFGAPDDAHALNPELGWHQGGVEGSLYDLALYPGGLMLVGATGTDMWANNLTAPMVTCPISGGLESQVRVVFTPLKDYQHAGIGVWSADDPSTWLRISRSMDRNAEGQSVYVIGHQKGSALRLNYARYREDEVWLRIVREGTLFTLSYSQDGDEWVPLEDKLPFEMDAEVEVFLFAFSTVTDQVSVAQFYDFRVAPR